MASGENAKYEKNNKEGKNSISDNVREEQFWFTATTLGVNGFLVATCLNPQHASLLKVVSTAISSLAAFLIIQRGGFRDINKDKLYLQQKCLTGWFLKKMSSWGCLNQRPFKRKLRETMINVWLLPRRFWFVILEFSGSSFYLALVVLSCLGVWLVRSP